MSEMTPETLRQFGDEMLRNGEFYAADAAMVDEFASSWAADRKRLEVYHQAEDCEEWLCEICNAVYPRKSLSGGPVNLSCPRDHGGCIPHETAKAMRLRARIEGLEKELAGIVLVSKGPYGLLIFNWWTRLQFIYAKAKAALAAEKKR